MKNDIQAPKNDNEINEKTDEEVYELLFNNKKNYCSAVIILKIWGILSKLRDIRYDFILNPREYDGTQKDLNDLIEEWTNTEKNITILDLAGIPYDIIDLVVGTISRLIFETMFWGRDLKKTGRQQPIALIFEEAHGYLKKGENSR